MASMVADIAFHVRLAQINLKAAHDGQHAAAFEFFAGDAAFEAAENCDAVEIGVRGTGAAPAIENLWPRRPCSAIGTDARAGGLPDHQDTDSDDDQGPDGIEVDMCDTEIFKNKQNSRGQQDDAPKASSPVAAAINQHGATGGDHDHRPEIAEDAVGVDEALLIEKEHNSGGDDQRAEEVKLQL